MRYEESEGYKIFLEKEVINIGLIRAIKNVIGRVRSNLANPQDWLIKMLNPGLTSKAGVDVNVDAALKISVVFACCNIIANTIASLPLRTFKLTTEGKIPWQHTVSDLIDNCPNDETTAFDFWQMLIFNLLLTGDGFAFIERDGNGTIVAIKNIPSGNVKVYRNKVTKEVYYTIKDADGNEKGPYYKENIFRVRGLRVKDSDKVENPIRLAQEAMGLSVALEEYAENYFANGANVGGVVEIDKEKGMSDDAFERFKKSFYEKYSGLKNSNKVFFLEDGAKFIKTSNNPVESQSLEARKFQVIEICRFFNVPPHKVFDLDRATFSNIEEQSTGFVQDCLTPMCVRIEQTIKRDLLLPKERKKIYAKFMLNGLLRGNTQARKEYYQAAINSGWMCPDDVRELEDLNPIPGGWGKQYMVNGNMVLLENVKNNVVKGGGKSDAAT